MEKPKEYPNPYITMECLPNGEGCKIFVYLPKEERLEELESQEFAAMIFLLMSGQFNHLVNKALVNASKESPEEIKTIISVLAYLGNKKQEKERSVKLVVPPTKAFLNLNSDHEHEEEE